MKTFLELAKARVSNRSYSAAPVHENDLQDILEAGRFAPTAANRQPFHIIVVKDPERREAVIESYSRDWFKEAPVILVVCIEPAQAWVRKDGRNYAVVDASIVMDHMTLCAADKGLGTCWIGAFNVELLSNALQLPDGIEPIAMTPVGYSDDPGREKKRKPAAEILHHEQW